MASFSYSTFGELTLKFSMSMLPAGSKMARQEHRYSALASLALVKLVFRNFCSQQVGELDYEQVSNSDTSASPAVHVPHESRRLHTNLDLHCHVRHMKLKGVL